MGLSTGDGRDPPPLEALSQIPGGKAQASSCLSLGKIHCTPETVIHRAHAAQSCSGQELESLAPQLLMLGAQSPEKDGGGRDSRGLPQGFPGAGYRGWTVVEREDGGLPSSAWWMQVVKRSRAASIDQN